MHLRVVLLLTVLAAPLSGRAATLGVDLEAVQLLGGSERSGFGGTLRLAQELDLDGMTCRTCRLSLEVGGSFAGLGSELSVVADTIWAGFAGARFSGGGRVRPSMYLRLGYADYEQEDIAQGDVIFVGGSRGIYASPGVALDFAFAPASVGVGAGAGVIFAPMPSYLGGASWLTAGVHAAVAF